MVLPQPHTPASPRQRRHRWSRPIAIAALAIGSLANPAAAETYTPVATPRNGAPVQLAQAAEPQPATWTLKLIDPGQEPRQELRLRPTVGDRQAISVLMQMETSVLVNGQPGPAPTMPTMSMDLSAVVDRVDPNRDIHYTLQYEAINFVATDEDNPFPSEMFASMFEPLKELKMLVVSSDRGQIKSVEFENIEGLDPMTQQMISQLSKSLDNLSAQFPEEPIGVGGQWQAIGVINLGGINLDQTVDFEVQSIDGDVVTLGMMIDQSADLGIGEGDTSVTTTGTGALTIDWTRLLPIAGQFMMESAATIDGGGSIGTIESETRIQMTITSGGN